ncbi:ribosome biogenesis GTPase YlqF [Aerococcus sanguinicola]|uniref:Ribosome biogenesis GTPase A n=1 Tax=Aerococcus sanguinicola TaxID=119206 RepID=A0A0X8FCM3_9LACT|nr:ribosome biogenesis GTPase YlqF [Aerococcus sanguinicola]AMB94798.1 ribosome biogenesis GTPase YlqF [Aerococcus sanguinicola]
MATIQWYPGHMAKAKKEVQNHLSQVDYVIELRDARVPESSKNPMIDQIIQDKPRIIVLNKSDLADKEETQAWLDLLNQEEGSQSCALNSKNPKEMKRFKKKLYDWTAPVREKWQAKGVKHQAVRLMIVGIPNVGKSTFINQFTQKKKAQVGNKPGVTKGQQWIRIDKDFELLDTPGILWPKFEDPEVGTRLALCTAIKQTHYYNDDIALYALAFLMDYYPGAIEAKYPISADQVHPPYPELLMTLTEKMGFLDDYDRASEKIIKDFQDGAISRLTLDRVADYEMAQEAADND